MCASIAGMCVEPQGWNSLTEEMLDAGVMPGDLGAAMAAIYTGGSASEAYEVMLARARPHFDPRLLLLPSGTMVAR